MISFPVAASQTRAVESVDPVTMRVPSGENDAEATVSVCPLRLTISRPVAAFQTRAVLSVDAVTTRGQRNAIGPGATDYGVWGGAISFNSDASWYFGASDGGLGPDESDFLTTAMHELGHVLGYGVADLVRRKNARCGLASGFEKPVKPSSMVR